jgi:hypothetical protein
MEGKHLASGLSEKIDYYPVTRKVWLFLRKMYGGGPELAKNSWLPVFEVPIATLIRVFKVYFPLVNLLTTFTISNICLKHRSYNNIKHSTKVSKRQFSSYTCRAIKMFA